VIPVTAYMTCLLPLDYQMVQAASDQESGGTCQGRSQSREDGWRED